MATTRLAVIGGDGIGPEVVAEGLKVLDAVLPGVETTEYDLGAAALARAPARCCRESVPGRAGRPRRDPARRGR